MAYKTHYWTVAVKRERVIGERVIGERENKSTLFKISDGELLAKPGAVRMRGAGLGGVKGSRVQASKRSAPVLPSYLPAHTISW